MDDTKLFAKNENESQTDTNNKNIQSGYMDGIRHRKMYHTNNEKLKMTNNGKTRTTKSRKNQNYWRKEKLQVLGNTGSRHHQTSKEKILKNKDELRRKRKFLETEVCSKNIIKEINTRAIALGRYSGPFLKWTRKELQQKEPRTKK